MANKMLVLRLEGPLQSWGIRARWDTRDSATEPTKSGIIGLLGCALGFRINDPRLEKLDQQLMMGIRVEREGTRLTDYQTVNCKSKEWRRADGSLQNKGIVSFRDYLQDAAFLVVLQGPSEIIEDCAAAIQAPVWPYYLGRKCCIPSRPIYDTVTDKYATILELFKDYPWEYGKDLSSSRNVTLRYVIDDVNGPYIRIDSIRCNTARKYGFRRVSVGKVMVRAGEVVPRVSDKDVP